MGNLISGLKLEWFGPRAGVLIGSRPGTLTEALMACGALSDAKPKK